MRTYVKLLYVSIAKFDDPTKAYHGTWRIIEPKPILDGFPGSLKGGHSVGISHKYQSHMLKPSWTSERRLLEVYILQKCNHNTWEFHQLVLDTLFKFIQTHGGFRTIFQYYNNLMTWLICLDSYFRKPPYRAYIEPLYTVQTQTFDHRFRRSSPFCGSHSPNAATLPQGVHGTNAPVDRTGTMRKYGNKNEKKASIMRTRKVLGTKMNVY